MIQVKWLVCIILKHMQINIGEKEILTHLHMDAVDRFNVTCARRPPPRLTSPSLRSRALGLLRASRLVSHLDGPLGWKDDFSTRKGVLVNTVGEVARDGPRRQKTKGDEQVFGVGLITLVSV